MTINFILLSSESDIASKNIAQQLIETYGFEKTNERFEDKPIYKKKAEQI